MLVVAALGGNALLRRNEPLDAAAQTRNVKLAAASLAEIAAKHDLVITHGNGPQVGLLALQSESVPGLPAFPLDVLNAETEGMIGYLCAREFRNHLPNREIATLITQVEVDTHDTAYKHPAKAIGPVYSYEEATQLAKTRGFRINEEAAGGFRRAVASP